MAKIHSILAKSRLRRAKNDPVYAIKSIGLLLAMLYTVALAEPIPLSPLTNGFVFVALTNPPPSSNLVSLNDSAGMPLSLAINGSGYLIVRDPVSGLLGATRLGELDVDPDGYLVTAYGKRVEGYNNPELTAIGDLQIDSAVGQDTSPLMSYDIQSNGCIMVTFADGLSFVRGQILLQNFQNPSALTAQGWQCFGWSSSAGPLPTPVPPGTAGTGLLEFGILEQMTPKLQLSPCAGPPQSFTQGILVSSEVPTDIGIEGNGFFVLRNTNDNSLYASRAGAFYLDASGYVVHYSGLRLQGYTDTLTTIGDLQIDAPNSPSTSDPGLYVMDYSIDQRGVITEGLSDGSLFVRGQILLEDCTNPNLAVRTNFDLYPLATNAALWTSFAPPLTGNLGWLVPGSLELSQFDTNLLVVRSHLNFFSHGYINPTGVPSDLAILGTGFFTVRDPVADIMYATRWGGFQLDTLGHLVTTNGLRLQGFTSGLETQIGDITTLSNYSIYRDGTIQVTMPDGAAVVGGQVLLQAYRNLQGLIPAGNGLYSNLVAALPIYPNGQPSQLSSIQTGAVEELPPPPAPLQLQLPPTRGFRLFITDLNEGVVESSPDLLHWTVLGPVLGSPDLNVAEFFDTPQTTQTFYRVVLPRSW